MATQVWNGSEFVDVPDVIPGESWAEVDLSEYEDAEGIRLEATNAIALVTGGGDHELLLAADGTLTLDGDPVGGAVDLSAYEGNLINLTATGEFSYAHLDSQGVDAITRVEATGDNGTLELKATGGSGDGHILINTGGENSDITVQSAEVGLSATGSVLIESALSSIGLDGANIDIGATAAGYCEISIGGTVIRAEEDALGFFGTAPAAKPDGVSAGDALEALGLAANVTESGGGGASHDLYSMGLIR